jgi:hypothetical protein
MFISIVGLGSPDKMSLWITAAIQMLAVGSGTVLFGRFQAHFRTASGRDKQALRAKVVDPNLAASSMPKRTLEKRSLSPVQMSEDAWRNDRGLHAGKLGSARRYWVLTALVSTRIKSGLASWPARLLWW